jgi:four helix bundle protein
VQRARHASCALARDGQERALPRKPEELGFLETIIRETATMFIAYEISKQLIVSLRPLVPVIQACDRELADQLRRAAQSVLLNLAEGQKYQNGNRKKHYEIAQGSANEVKAALDAAEAWGWLEERGEERELLDRLLAVLWKLTHAELLQKLERRKRV